jgi:hypothetical protein
MSVPARFTDTEARERFLETLATTCNFTAACAVAGWDESTERAWRNHHAARAIERREKGEPLTDFEAGCIDWVADVARALAQAPVNAALAVQARLVPFEAKRERHERRLNKDGDVVEVGFTETTIIPPDGRLGLQVLERRLSEQWAPPARLEVSGPGGNAVQFEVDVVTLDAIAARMVERHSVEVESRELPSDGSLP